MNTSAQTQHPVAFSTKADIEYVKANIKTNALLKDSYDEIKKSVDEWVCIEEGVLIDVFSPMREDFVS